MCKMMRIGLFLSLISLFSFNLYASDLYSSEGISDGILNDIANSNFAIDPSDHSSGDLTPAIANLDRCLVGEWILTRSSLNKFLANVAESFGNKLVGSLGTFTFTILKNGHIAMIPAKVTFGFKTPATDDKPQTYIVNTIKGLMGGKITNNVDGTFLVTHLRNYTRVVSVTIVGKRRVGVHFGKLDPGNDEININYSCSSRELKFLFNDNEFVLKRLL
ncbi:MAG: hypothetical protein HQK53_05325 [Oligoflexia bacterium]|nr:hypothetical protein [Oligoflexia bacterium]